VPVRLQSIAMLVECAAVLATCKLSIKQTFCDWIDRWQPDRSHLSVFTARRYAYARSLRSPCDL